MRTALLVLCISSAAHADTFQATDTYGLDLSTVWEPQNRDAFGAGPVFRYESHDTRMPDWLAAVLRMGLFLDSADRFFSSLSAGLVVKPFDAGLYATLEGGVTLSREDLVMEERMRLSGTGSVSVGWRLGIWDLRATGMLGGLFDQEVWLFSIGRDFIRLDSAVTLTRL